MNHSARRRQLWTGCLLLVILLSGCTPAQPPATATAAVLAPSATSPAATHTPAPSPTPTETAAVPPAEIATAAPAAGGALSRSGPWLAYQAENRLWAVNADGSGRTELAGAPLDLSRELAASPPGTPPRLAMVVSHAGFPQHDDVSLRILRLPEGSVEAEIDLLAFAGPAGDEEAVRQSRAAAALNIGMSWSPSGRYLAFVGVIDGPSADVYRYDSQTGEVRRMSAEPQQVGALAWSPDEEWIVYQVVEDFGTGAGWSALGVWAAPAGGGGGHELLAGRQQVYAGWTGQGELVTSPWEFGFGDAGAPGSDVVAVDPAGGAARTLLSAEEVARGATVVMALLPGSEDSLAVAIAGEGGADRLVIVPAGGGPARTILNGPAQGLPALAWSAELERLLVAWDAAVLQVSPEGEVEVSYPERALPVVSPDGEWLAFFGSEEADGAGVRLYRPNGELAQTLSEQPATSLLWQPQGRLVFSVAGERLYAQRIPAGQTWLVQENMPAYDFQHSMVWVGVQ